VNINKFSPDRFIPKVLRNFLDVSNSLSFLGFLGFPDEWSSCVCIHHTITPRYIILSLKCCYVDVIYLLLMNKQLSLQEPVLLNTHEFVKYMWDFYYYYYNYDTWKDMILSRKKKCHNLFQLFTFKKILIHIWTHSKIKDRCRPGSIELRTKNVPTLYWNHTQLALVMFSQYSASVVRHKPIDGVVYGIRAWFKYDTALSAVV